MHLFDLIVNTTLVLLAFGFCAVVLFFAWHLLGVFLLPLLAVGFLISKPAKPAK